MPVLFAGHGSPMNAIERNPWSAAWHTLAARLPRPRAILCVSAHWETRGVYVTATPTPETIHDFYGFPKPLFDVRYPAPGDAALARRIAELGGDVPIRLDPGRGLDHGSWSVLRVMYPAADIPVLQTGNTSLGVTLLAALVREAAARLGPEWDIEVVEMHHREKIDAPSGTAQLLGQAAAAGRGEELASDSVVGRAGLTGRRIEGTIGFASLRGGTVAGDHQVVFAGDGERLELGHRAESRAIFASGAIRAALWLIGKPAGRYTMAQVLDL